MRLTRAKVAANPNANFVSWRIERRGVGFKECVKVAAKLAGYHILFQLLLKGVFARVLYLNYAIDRTVNVAFKKVMDVHGFPLGNLECAVVVIWFYAVEQGERFAGVSTREERDYRHAVKVELHVVEQRMHPQDG